MKYPATTAVLCLAAISCNKKAPAPATPPGLASSLTSSLALADLGAPTATIALSFHALSSAPAFAAANLAEAASHAKATDAGELRASELSLALFGEGPGGDDDGGLGLTDLSASETAGAPGFKASSVLSGPADALQVILTKIELEEAQPTPNSAPTTVVTAAAVGPSPAAQTNCSGKTPPPAVPKTFGAVTNLVLFNQPGGTLVSAAAGSLDLGSLGGACGVIPVAASPHTYNQITLTFLRAAVVSGCVQGNASDQDSASPTGHGTETYCTRKAYATFDGVKATNADFQQNTSAELMAIDLAPWQGPQPASPYDTVSITVPLSPALTVSTAGDSLPLAVVLDLNRLLRFHRQNAHPGTHPVPEAQAAQSWFFTSSFASAVYALGAAPGHFYGYDLVAEACPVASYAPAAQLCGGVTVAQGPSHAANPWTALGAWMTVVTGSNGVPLLVNLIPNDDSDLGLMRGGIQGLSTPFNPGANGPTTDIAYAATYATQSGTLLGMPTDLGASASGSDAVAPAVGTTLSAVSFTATAPGPHPQAYRGPVFMQVGLSN